MLLLTDRLRMSARLGLLVVVLLAPALAASWAFTSAINAQIAFGSSERSGLVVVRPALAAMVDTVAGRTPDLAALHAAVAAHPELDATAAADDVDAAARAAQPSSPASRLQLASALSALITQVGNTSNLILDPDLDSFYVMDATIVQLPKGLMALADAPTLPSGAQGPVAAAAVRAGAVTSAADSLGTDSTTAAANSARDDLDDRLAPVHTLVSALTSVAAGLTGAADRPSADAPAALKPALDAASASVDALTATLDQLLVTRTDGMGRHRLLVLAPVGAGLLLAMYAATAVWWRTRHDVALTVAGLAAMADGDLRPRTMPDLSDEYGTIGRSLTVVRERMRDLLSAVTATTDGLGAASSSLTGTSQTMNTAATAASADVGAVAEAARQVAHEVDAARTGTEQLGLAVRQISASTSEAAHVADQAVLATRHASTTVANLGASSSEITAVVDLIASIAGQTNLLSLNATIEAARAGEAGKGFAVVAHEVKELATETARATSEISQRIEAIQADVRRATTGMDDLGAVIARITDCHVVVAAAVQQQATTTEQMAGSMAAVAGGTDQIAGAVSALAEAAGRTRDDAERTAVGAASVGTAIGALQDQLSGYKH